MHSSTRLWLAAAGALAASFIVPATAGAVTADLRVEASNGRMLADTEQRTSPASVKTDPGADCFGAGTGGSGDRVDIPNNTALGLLADALPNNPDLRPLSISDHFSFGLALCGIGGHVASGDASWYLKDNHVGAQVGGDQLKVHNGDEVLWYLTPKSFPPPKELVLRAPARAKPDEPVTVKVLSYNDNGKHEPDKGAKVGFGADPTNGDGETEVTFPATGHPHLQARDGNAIPSNLDEVCVKEDPSRCPSAG
jgi:hypothetical protein